LIFQNMKVNLEVYKIDMNIDNFKYYILL